MSDTYQTEFTDSALFYPSPPTPPNTTRPGHNGATLPSALDALADAAAANSRPSVSREPSSSDTSVPGQVPNGLKRKANPTDGDERYQQNGMGRRGTENTNRSSASPDEAEGGNAGTAATKKKPSRNKTERKQLVSCDACRLRRVKCVKAPGETDCKQCQAKSVTCTDDYVRNKPRTQKRSGKLIEKAKALYGDSYNPLPFCHSDSNEPDRFRPHGHLPNLEYTDPLRPSVLAAPDPSIAHPIPSSTEQRIVSAELTQTLSAHLVECYFAASHFQIPAVEWDLFKEAFDKAGRRSADLDPANQFLCSVVEAFGARVSDSPYILGPGCPKLSTLKSQQGVDLSVWGKRREAFCEAMLERAITVCDRTAAMRIPVQANMSGLVLLDHLFQFRDPQRRGGRVYTAALIELMRIINDDAKAGVEVDKGLLASIEGGRVWWHIFLTDICKAIIWRKPAQITAFDIDQLCPGSKAGTFQSIWTALNTDNPQALVECAITGLFGYLASAAHAFVDWLCLPGPQHLAQEFQAIRDLYQSIDQSIALCDLFQTRVNLLIPSGSSNFALWHNNLAVIRGMLALNAEVYVKAAVEREERSMDRDMRVWYELRDEAARRTYEGSRDIARIFEKCRIAGHLLGGCWPLFPQAYAHALLDTPLSTQGGPADYDIQTKRSETQAMIDGLKCAGWCWSGFEPAIAELEARLEAVEREAGSASMSLPQQQTQGQQGMIVTPNSAQSFGTAQSFASSQPQPQPQSQSLDWPVPRQDSYGSQSHSTSHATSPYSPGRGPLPMPQPVSGSQQGPNAQHPHPQQHTNPHQQPQQRQQQQQQQSSMPMMMPASSEYPGDTGLGKYVFDVLPGGGAGGWYPGQVMMEPMFDGFLHVPMPPDTEVSL